MARLRVGIETVGKWAISSRHGVLRFKTGTVATALSLYANHFNLPEGELTKMADAGEVNVTEWSDGTDPGKAVAEVHGKGGGGNKPAETN